MMKRAEHHPKGAVTLSMLLAGVGWDVAPARYHMVSASQGESGRQNAMLQRSIGGDA